jgi:hypothetical protein
MKTLVIRPRLPDSCGANQTVGVGDEAVRPGMLACRRHARARTCSGMGKHRNECATGHGMAEQLCRQLACMACTLAAQRAACLISSQLPWCVAVAVCLLGVGWGGGVGGGHHLAHSDSGRVRGGFGSDGGCFARHTTHIRTHARTRARAKCQWSALCRPEASSFPNHPTLQMPCCACWLSLSGTHGVLGCVPMPRCMEQHVVEGHLVELYHSLRPRQCALGVQEPS